MLKFKHVTTFCNVLCCFLREINRIISFNQQEMLVKWVRNLFTVSGMRE